jgi:dihydrofolate synthase/folylpolyglutamate synthase
MTPSGVGGVVDGVGRALAALYARAPQGMRLNQGALEAMRQACAAAGSPEQAYPVVHVAGTNGKGSVCAMIESIARASGLRTGLYTSPHLCRFAERIRVDGEPITDVALADVLERALTIGHDLSFFEAATLAAFLAFRDAKVDLAVIEVGIGGRLDATNVVATPRAAAITRIAFDHMDKLGGTLVEIAREKAGIAKPGGRVFVGPGMPDDVRAAIDEVAAANGATTEDADSADARAFFARHPPLGLQGAHQSGNATVAYRLARQLSLTESAIATGLRDVRWPGRLESIASETGPVLLDGAHNPDGALALARHLRSESRPLAIVFGALADKAWPAMLDLLAPLTPHRVYVEPHGRAATSPASLSARHAGVIAGSVADALDRARALVGAGGVVTVCGSLYLVGEARAHLLHLPSDPPVAL